MQVLPLSDGSRRYRLEVSHGPYTEGFDVFMIEITPEYAHQLLERMNLFATAQAKDDSLFEMYFWDCSGDFFALDSLQTDDSDPLVPVDEPSRSECNQVVIRAEEVVWFGYPKHGDDQLTTEAIPRKDLLEIASAHLICRCR